MIIETPSQKLPEAIATLMTTCYSIDVNRAMDRIEDLLKPLAQSYIISDYFIKPQSKDTNNWTLKIELGLNRNLLYAIVTMGIKRSEMGFTTWMELEEWNPYKKAAK